MEENYWTRRGRRADRRRAAGRGLSRRGFLAGAAGAAFLAACGSSDKDKSKATTAPATQAAAGAQPAGTQAAAQATPPPKGGTITTAIIATDGKSFHPYQTVDSASGTYEDRVYGVDLLTRDHVSLQLVGNGAEKWTVSDDKKTYTFTLKDTKWSDGTPLTSADYAWTFDQAINPANKYPRLSTLSDIVKYEAVDPKTVRITLKDALAIGLDTADQITPLPKHIWEKYDWGDPVKNPEILNPTVGSGVFKLKEWKKDQFATFVASDNYFEGRPNIDQLTYRVFGTQALAFQALKAGEIDWHSIQPADFKEAKTLSNINVLEYFAATTGYTYVGFNMRRPHFKDVNVRKALAYATDRKGIIDAVVEGQGRPVYSHYTQSSWVYNPNVEKYDFDPKKAADLLKSAGYTQGSDKKLRKDGQELKLKLLFNTGNLVREGIATVMKQQFGELGITVDVVPMEFQAYIEFISKEPFDYDLFVLGWTGGFEPHFSIQIWSEKGIPDLNSGAYLNKEIERLYDQGAREFDTEKRKGIYQQIQKLMTDDPPYIFLYEGKVNVGLNKKIGGVKPSPIGIVYNLKDWYVTK
jgi:peptide/nickel transport system substrate-binding protein